VKRHVEVLLLAVLVTAGLGMLGAPPASASLPVGHPFPVWSAQQIAIDQTVLRSDGTRSESPTSSRLLPSISSSAPADASVGSTFTHTVTATGSRPMTFKVTAGELPDGLTLDPVTGVLSGTPTRAQSSTYTITASNAMGLDAQRYTQHVGASKQPGADPNHDSAIPVAVDAGREASGKHDDRRLPIVGTALVAAGGVAALICGRSTRRRH
jgi:putative Ig domain-containing protein